MKIKQLDIGSELYKAALELRYELFFKKHDLPRTILIDEHEHISQHIAIVSDDSLIAYGRLTNVGEGIYQLSQIVVKPQEQGKGYGTMILRELVKHSEHLGCDKIILNARTTTIALYKKHGFKSHGAEFLSKNTRVPHIQMTYTPNNTRLF